MPESDQRATGSLEEIGRLDHEVTAEYRIFGPPGCGKTTNVARQIRRAVERYGPDRMLVTSFSRTAAAELAGRDLPVPPDRVGTLHSHCWHALGGPEIAESHVSEWNRDNPSLAITPQKKQAKLDGEEAGDDDDTETKKGGDGLLQQLNRARGRMLDRSLWPPMLRQFEQRWTEYKRENGLLDFTDLIETALRDIAIAPRNPSVIFADEAQDLNRMQLTLVRKWGERAQYFIVSGDDDQTIFSFAGATPEAFLDPDVPQDHKIILKRSYRVPRAVHGLAENLIRRVTRRQAKEYVPRDADGAVVRLSWGTYKSAEYDILTSAEKHLTAGKSVMFLASCAYMLRPLVAVLRKRGIPFHNPYRRSNGYWNPIRIGKRTSTAGRILALLVAHPGFGEGHHPWTMGDVADWAEFLHSKGVLRHGAKAALKVADPSKPATMERLDEIFEATAFESLMTAWDGDYGGLLEWWRARVTSDAVARVRYPAAICASRGPQALIDTPQVVVGTIHSVKGGQADTVYIVPDLSQAADAQYARSGPSRDAVIRLFYVGATRAFERLYICSPETPRAVSI